MQHRQFQFERHDQDPLAVSLFCREPPEAQAGKTLTWQLDRSSAARADGGSSGGSSSGGTGATGGSGDGGAADADLIGLDIWPAAIALCRYMAANPQLVAGQKVLELGAGMGLVGLACASLGAQHVLLTDYEPQVLAHLGSNAALNSLQSVCASQQLDWRRPQEGLGPEQRGVWKLVVAADVLYASVVVQPLIDTLQLALHPEGIALVGHQVRRAIILDPTTRLPRLEECDEPLEKFKACCAAQGLAVRVLSSRPTCSNVDSDPMVLLAVGRQAGRLEQLPLPAGAG